MTFAGCGVGGQMRGGPAANQTRGRAQGGGLGGVNYPNPFFDIAHTYLPTVKELFKYCRYYFLTSPLINATVFKLSEYPITDLIIDHEDDSVKKRWRGTSTTIFSSALFRWRWVLITTRTVTPSLA